MGGSFSRKKVTGKTAIRIEDAEAILLKGKREGTTIEIKKQTNLIQWLIIKISCGKLKKEAKELQFRMMLTVTTLRLQVMVYFMIAMLIWGALMALPFVIIPFGFLLIPFAVVFYVLFMMLPINLAIFFLYMAIDMMFGILLVFAIVVDALVTLFGLTFTAILPRMGTIGRVILGMINFGRVSREKAQMDGIVAGVSARDIDVSMQTAGMLDYLTCGVMPVFASRVGELRWSRMVLLMQSAFDAYLLGLTLGFTALIISPIFLFGPIVVCCCCCCMALPFVIMSIGLGFAVLVIYILSRLVFGVLLYITLHMDFLAGVWAMFMMRWNIWRGTKSRKKAYQKAAKKASRIGRSASADGARAIKYQALYYSSEDGEDSDGPPPGSPTETAAATFSYVDKLGEFDNRELDKHEKVVNKARSEAIRNADFSQM
jgi:hypothetical protein